MLFLSEIVAPIQNKKVTLVSSLEIDAPIHFII